MPFRGAVELESALNTRLYHLVHSPLSGEAIEARLKAVFEVAIKSALIEMASSGQIPTELIKESVDVWAQKMTDIAILSSNFKAVAEPQVELNLRNMTSAIFRDYSAPRVPISPFLRPGVGFQGIKPARVIRDEALALDLERRGLEEIVLPKEGNTKLEGRRRIGEGVQKALAEMEVQRQKQLEEQRKLDREEKELESTGFGRKVDLD